MNARLFVSALCGLTLGACDFFPPEHPVTTGIGSIGDSAGDSSGGPDSGDAWENEAELCEAYCATEESCFLPPGVPPQPREVCVETCLENLHVFDDTPECATTMRDYTVCLAESEACQVPCLDAIQEDLHACEVGHSVACGGASNGQSGAGCFYEKSCEFGGDDLIREVRCEGEACTCLENGLEVGSCTYDACSDPGSWDDIETWTAGEQACCGWS